MIPEPRARHGSHFLDTLSFYYLQITSYLLRDLPDSVPSPVATGHSTRCENSEITKILSLLAAKEQLRLTPEQVKACYVVVPPLLSTVEIRAIRHYNGFI